MAVKSKYLFGPVPSRRLGLSLGVDIVPLKTCTLDCVYCQLGKGKETTTKRKEYVPIEEVLSELKEKLAGGLQADHITISGSGEPTLNSRFGELIDGIKKITNIPVAVITNGTLLYDSSVRADCAKADVVLPSLDAGDEEMFRKINRPHRDITLAKLVEGLRAFRREFTGRIWLEVFFCEGINTSDDQIRKIRDITESIGVDKIQLNTAVRPAAESGALRVEEDKLRRIAEFLGGNVEIIADFSRQHQSRHSTDSRAEILAMLTRRPCTLEDIYSGLGINPAEAVKCIGHLLDEKVVISENRGGKLFYKTI